MSAPSYGLGRKQYVDKEKNEKQINAYKKMIRQIAQLFGNNSKHEELLKERINEIVELESKLKLATTPDEEKRSASVWYNKMSLGQLNRLVDDYIDFTQLIVDLADRLNVNVTVNHNTTVIVDDVPYYKKVVQILDETPAYVIKNYLGWIIVNTYASFTNKQVSKIVLEYNKISSGIEASPARSQKCLNTVNNKLSSAISSPFVKQFVARNTKEKATEMIAYIQNAFRNILTEENWLDEQTKRKALFKLNNFRINVAYPDWLLNDTALDEYYTLVNQSVVQGQYLESVLKFNRIIYRNTFDEMNKPFDPETRWEQYLFYKLK